MACMLGIVTCLAFLLHKLRDIHPAIVYVQLLFFAVAFAALNGVDRVTPRFLLVRVFGAFVCLHVAFLSFYHSSAYGSPGIGLVRYGFWFAMVMLFTGAWFTDRSYRLIQNVLIGFSVVCSLTILYQCLWGPISWFVEAGERAGAVRYASLAGSLTVYGGLVGSALFLVVRRPTTPLLVVTQLLLLVGAFFSYQKAALLGSGLAYVCAYLMKPGKLKIKDLIVGAAAVGVLLVALMAVINSNESVKQFINGALGLLDADEMSDVTITQSIYDRMSDLPLACIQFFSDDNLWLGVGVFGAGGATGYENIPMPHNLVVEILLIHGYLLGGILCILMFALALRAFYFCCSASKEHVVKTASGVYLLTLAASLGAGSVYFHPVLGCFFWSAAFMIMKNRAKTAGAGGGKLLPEMTSIPIHASTPRNM